MKLIRIKQAYKKNVPELLAIVRRQFPNFVTEASGDAGLLEIPVFVFHAVEPKYLQSQLQYLRDNGYRTIGAEELDVSIRNGTQMRNRVVLTFDDATWSFWTYAYPLLVKFDMQAVLFAIPGIVPDDANYSANLDDYWNGSCSIEELSQRALKTPLCTWRELQQMHRSGHVDIQSHSLTHSRISISEQVIDFLRPDFDTDFYGNVNIPITSLDEEENPARVLRLGTPVFENVSRMTCKKMYRVDADLIHEISHYVDNNGGREFFDRFGWQRILGRKFAELRQEKRRIFETQIEAEDAVRREFQLSKALLESRLSSKVVRHFCYPWYEGSERSNEIAAECGYSTVHYGHRVVRNNGNSIGDPVRSVARVSDDYLFRLPGRGRKSLSAIWLRRLKRFGGRNSGEQEASLR